MRRLLQIMIALCLLSALLPAASAISLSHDSIVSPILYEPGKAYTYSFTVSDYGYDAIIEVEGDWAKYVLINDITSALDGKKEFSITVMPPKVPDTPGLHYIYVGAREITPPGSGNVGAIAGVRKQIGFDVLYPFKAITAGLTASDVNIGDPVHFRVGVKSESLLTIHKISATIKVTDGDGNHIASLPTSSMSLKLGEHKSLSASLDTTGLKPATYYASATVTYDGNMTTLEDSFRVGTLKVDITDHTKEVKVGAIAPFFIEVKSGWNDRIENVHGEAYIEGKSAVKTPTLALKPWEHMNLTGYFDANGWEPGIYNSTIIISFGQGDSTIKKGTLTIIEQKNAGGGWIANIGWMHLLIAGIITLITLLVVNLLFLTRKRKKGEKKK